MATQVSNHNFTNIGRMFARQAVPAVYGRHKQAETEEAEPVTGQVDQVSLSASAPKPLSGSLLTEALDTASVIGAGGRLSTDRVERLREDRVFSAITALAAMGVDGGEASLPRYWPGGLPAPSSEEMEAARRRLAQRLQFENGNTGDDRLQQSRLELSDRIRSLDLTAVSPAAEPE